MKYFIVLIIVSLVIAPILWIMPSPRQKRQMALRQKAMTMGLQVKICDLPQTHRQQVRKEHPEQGVVYRMVSNGDGKSNDQFEYRCLREHDKSVESQNTAMMSVLNNALNHLPNDVVALEYSNTGIAAYWREKGGVEQVDTIYQQLKIVKNMLSDINRSIDNE